MDRSSTSGNESIQGHFDLVHAVATGSQDHLVMPTNHQIDMPFKMAPQNFSTH